MSYGCHTNVIRMSYGCHIILSGVDEGQGHPRGAGPSRGLCVRRESRVGSVLEGAGHRLSHRQVLHHCVQHVPHEFVCAMGNIHCWMFLVDEVLHVHAADAVELRARFSVTTIWPPMRYTNLGWEPLETTILSFPCFCCHDEGATPQICSQEPHHKFEPKWLR